THRRGQLRVFCVHLRRSAGDFDHFRSLADLQLKVHVRDDTRIQHDVVIRVSLEAGGFGRQLVRTDRKFLHRIVTAGIGRSGNGNADCRVCNRNLGARNGGAGWIQHGTGKLAVLHLRECAEGQSQHGKYYEAKLQSLHLLTPWSLWRVMVVVGTYARNFWLRTRSCKSSIKRGLLLPRSTQTPALQTRDFPLYLTDNVDVTFSKARKTACLAPDTSTHSSFEVERHFLLQTTMSLFFKYLR